MSLVQIKALLRDRLQKDYTEKCFVSNNVVYFKKIFPSSDPAALISIFFYLRKEFLKVRYLKYLMTTALKVP